MPIVPVVDPIPFGQGVECNSENSLLKGHTQPLAQITIIDANHGDSLVVDLHCGPAPGVQQAGYAPNSWMRWLIDTGTPSAGIRLAIQRVLGDGKVPDAYFNGNQLVSPNPSVPSVSVVQVTHPDFDHYGNVMDVLAMIEDGLSPPGAELYMNRAVPPRRMSSFFFQTQFSFHPFQLASPDLRIEIIPNAADDELELQALIPQLGTTQMASWFDEIGKVGIRAYVDWAISPVDQFGTTLDLYGDQPGIDTIHVKYGGPRLRISPQDLADLGAGQTEWDDTDLTESLYCAIKVNAYVRLQDNALLKSHKKPDLPRRFLETTLFAGWKDLGNDKWGLRDLDPNHTWNMAERGVRQPGQNSVEIFGRMYQKLQILSGRPDPELNSSNMVNNPLIPMALPPLGGGAAQPCVPSNYMLNSAAGQRVPMSGRHWKTVFLGPTPKSINRLNRACFFTQLYTQMTDDDAATSNRASIVTLFRTKGANPPINMLFTGDAFDGSCDLTDTMNNWTARLIDNPPKIQVDVLKVPHHGSINSADAEFYETFRAQIYLITTQVSPHGHPTYEVLEAIIRGFRWTPGMTDANNQAVPAPARPYHLFFSSPEIMSDAPWGQGMLRSALRRIYKYSDLAPRPIPAAPVQGQDYYPYRCFRLRSLGEHPNANNDRTSGRILLGRDMVSGALTLQFSVLQGAELVSTVGLNNVPFMDYNTNDTNDWVEITTVDYPHRND